MAAKYEQIANDIRGRIIRGELQPGERLPSERELAERWGVNRLTVTAAYRQLRAEGLVESRQGEGTFVRERPPVHVSLRERYEHSRQAGFIYRPGEYAEILSADVVPAPEDVAGVLGVEPGADVIRRVRVTYEGDTPATMSTSWHPGELAEACPRLLATQRIREGSPRYIETATGRRAATIRQWSLARLATPEERERLSLDDPAAVSEVHGVLSDAEGRPLEYGVSIAGGGRVLYSEERSLA